ncbi:MAG: hypothetical protein U1E46_03655 [Hyphomicrobiales bacterium]
MNAIIDNYEEVDLNEQSLAVKEQIEMLKRRIAYLEEYANATEAIDRMYIGEGIGPDGETVFMFGCAEEDEFVEELERASHKTKELREGIYPDVSDPYVFLWKFVKVLDRAVRAKCPSHRFDAIEYEKILAESSGKTYEATETERIVA